MLGGVFCAILNAEVIDDKHETRAVGCICLCVAEVMDAIAADGTANAIELGSVVQVELFFRFGMVICSILATISGAGRCA